MSWKYTDSSHTVVSRSNADGSYQSCLVEAIAEWIAEGNTPTPADPIPVPAITVTPWQIRKALNQLGLRSAVEDAIFRSADQELKDGWEFSNEITRDSPLVIGMAAALSKTDAEVDALFDLAKIL